MPRKKQYQWQKDCAPETDAGPSRSAKKRECHALQALGETLTRLAPTDWQQLDLPPDLLEALHLHGRIRDREGKRRQLQYIGRLMRHVNTEELQAALAARQDATAGEAARFHAVEQWRERLMAAPQQELANVLQEWLRHTGGQAISATTDWSALIAAAREEQAQHEMQRASGKKQAPHARRALFRALAAALAARPPQ